MKQNVLKPLLSFTALTFALTLSACGGSDKPDRSDSGPQSGSDSQAAALEDGSAALPQCDGQPIDQAEFLFTEIDRQWTCSVTSSQLTSVDSVYFSRGGTATFSRFGDVYWNRDLQSDAINIASPVTVPFVLRDITSANTTLQFNLSDDRGSEQFYDCVLVQREEVS